VKESIVKVGLPGGGEVQAGKLVAVGGRFVYVYDNPTIYRLLKALGVNKAVLVAMQKSGVSEIHFNLNGRCLKTTVADVIRYGIEDPARRKADHIYLELRHWHVIPRPSYPWVSASQVVRLPYCADAPALTIAREKAAAEMAAARASQPAQLALALA
jgi:hypothetical protein